MNAEVIHESDAGTPTIRLSDRERAAFLERLDAAATRLKGIDNLDGALPGLAGEICDIFGADRMTLYQLSRDQKALVCRVKSGAKSFRELKLPVTELSLPGFAAARRVVVRVADVYDEGELRRLSPRVSFPKAVDQRTGYRSRQMLLAPLLGAHDNALLGVVQMVNTRSGAPFDPTHEAGMVALSQALGVAVQRARGRTSQATVAGKFEHLVTKGAVSRQDLESAAAVARRQRRDLEEVLLEEHHIPLPEVGEALSRFFGVPYEPHRTTRVRPVDLLKNLKREYCESSQWVPLENTKEGIRVVSTDPERLRNSRWVENVFPGARVEHLVTTGREFTQLLDLLFGGEAQFRSAGESIGDLLSGLADDEEPAASDELSAASDNELVRLVNRIIIDAHNQGASDIHIEPVPGRQRTGVRFRKDGTLFNYIEVPASYRSAMVTRLKIMCDMDISEKRKPQDGKIKFRKFGPLDIELRVATIPTAGGMEDVVMRILSTGEPLPIDKIGLTPVNMARLTSAVSKPYGIFFVCGPTGSGKTTTLHSVLSTLNTAEAKIWTAEDPVEITQRGLRQCQVNAKAGFTFAAAMRAFLRADPDIIMVGEMRDKETTAVGLEASLTGHLVFATLHTNSAPESIVRLLDMGMDPFNFADALLGVLAQRLAKRLCSCKQPYRPSDEESRHFLQEYCAELENLPGFKADPAAGYQKVFDRLQSEHGYGKAQLQLYRPVGCDECNHTGYRGRVGLFELLLGSGRVKRIIQEHGTVADLLVACLEEGMTTLKMDGMEKVLRGVTDMAQVRAVCIK